MIRNKHEEKQICLKNIPLKFLNPDKAKPHDKNY